MAETSDDYSHTFFLRSQPVYQTWTSTNRKDGTETWSWKEMEDDCLETNQPVELTLTGDSTVSCRRHDVHRMCSGV
jgi:hypothetical protein